MEVLYPHCAGLDAHKETVVACMCHAIGGVRREVGTFKTTTQDLMALSDWLVGEGCTQAVMEATGVYWKPVWHILDGNGLSVTLANCPPCEECSRRAESDVADAAWLADLVAHGLIRASFVPDAATQDMRSLARAPASSSCASTSAI